MNGFGALVEQMFSEFDHVLLVVPEEGQTLRTDTLPVLSLYAREDIEAVSLQLEQTALIRYKDHQLPARVMGVDDNFTRTAHIDSIISDGFYSVWDGAWDRAVLGRGLAAQIGINAHFTGALHLYAPERTGNINLLRPDLSLRHEYAFIAGTFAVNQIEYDNELMLVSLPLAQRLFDYDEHTGTALRIQPKERGKISNLKQQISNTLGPGYKVLDRYEQQESTFKIMKIEKLISYIFLTFILLIACFNIIGSLTMLMIEKKQDALTLRNLGATHSQISQIFMLEGRMISLMGAIAGILIGLALCLIQQHYGVIRFGSQEGAYIIDSYPVSVHLWDLVLIFFTVIAVGFLSVWYPVKSFTSKFADKD
jgi:lipoprotein-releasing system permease protein